ncbi:SCAN domain-containing protein 3-like [Lutzomyia longipalpis]|uniref:SCAN domain-containing protein 3-like n=1 Tax=Lutzomyia longipalpis TaxID=7200 RepID=UPI0024846309|nr:SCAN domain-containing protein 3-like [Lutzomyia longipalpis]
MHWASRHANVPMSNEPKPIIPESKKPVKRLTPKKAATALAFETAKMKKNFTDAGKWRNAFVKVLRSMSNDCSCADQLQSIPLSRNTMSRRISKISCAFKSELIAKIREATSISIAMDETTDNTHKSQLMVYVRGIMPNKETFEDFLDLKSMPTTTKATDIYDQVMEALRDFGALDKLECVTMDGAPSMSGVKNGCGALIKRTNPDVKTLKCVIHSQVLSSRKIGLKSSMDAATKVINCIRGGHNALTHRRFKEFLKNHGAPQKDLLLFTNVRWLSKGQALGRFFDLRKFIIDFAETVEVFFFHFFLNFFYTLKKN